MDFETLLRERELIIQQQSRTIDGLKATRGLIIHTLDNVTANLLLEHSDYYGKDSGKVEFRELYKAQKHAVDVVKKHLSNLTERLCDRERTDAAWSKELEWLEHHLKSWTICQVSRDDYLCVEHRDSQERQEQAVENVKKHLSDLAERLGERARTDSEWSKELEWLTHHLESLTTGQVSSKEHLCVEQGDTFGNESIEHWENIGTEPSTLASGRAQVSPAPDSLNPVAVSTLGVIQGLEGSRDLEKDGVSRRNSSLVQKSCAASKANTSILRQDHHNMGKDADNPPLLHANAVLRIWCNRDWLWLIALLVCIAVTSLLTLMCERQSVSLIRSPLSYEPLLPTGDFASTVTYPPNPSDSPSARDTSTASDESRASDTPSASDPKSDGADVNADSGHKPQGPVFPIYNNNGAGGDQRLELQINEKMDGSQWKDHENKAHHGGSEGEEKE